MVIVSLPVNYDLSPSSRIFSPPWEFPLVICESELIFLLLFLRAPGFLSLAPSVFSHCSLESGVSRLLLELSMNTEIYNPQKNPRSD